MENKVLLRCSLKGCTLVINNKSAFRGTYKQSHAYGQICSSEASELADIEWDYLGFGLLQTYYMYMMKCTQGGNFCKGELQRFENIELNPSAGVLNYGQGLFEGLKAYRKEGNTLLFHLEEKALRMRLRAKRMCTPSPTVEQFVEAVKEIVLANKSWFQGFESWAVGKIMAIEYLNSEAMYRVFRSLWYTKEEVGFVALKGVVIVKFGYLEDRSCILNLTPWLFDRCLFSMLHFEKRNNIDSYEFWLSPFSLKVYNIPIELIDCQTALDVGNALGELVAID
ncbi:hypothetical protein GOBAR_DD02477 [Gossypium barbadense]|nr:hypothetical protein GOBAR_DD02477 [Gossypium barbadense]